MLKRWTRISLVVLGLVALVVSAHRLADSAVTRQLEDALARLDAAIRAGGGAATNSSSDETSRFSEGLARAIDACESALGPDRFHLMQLADDESDPTSIEDLVPIVADSRLAFVQLDIALASEDRTLALHGPGGDRIFGDFMNLARLCGADVRVRLHAKEFDEAARSIQRITSLANALEHGPSWIAQIVRISLIYRVCREGRSLLEQAPNPAALPEFMPRSPAGSMAAAWQWEMRRSHEAIASALKDGADLAKLITGPSQGPMSYANSTSFVEPWLKSALVELTDHLLEVRHHLEPTPGNVARLRALEDSLRTDGNRFLRNNVPSIANLLSSELESGATIVVLRAGARACAQFRERGAWPAPESFGTDVVAKFVDGDLELRSAVVSTVTWKLVAPRQSEETRDR